MKFTGKKSLIKTFRKGDKDFVISDGIVVAPRAGFEFASEMPGEYRTIIRTCLDNGWLKPVANVKEQEYMWEKLCD